MNSTSASSGGWRYFKIQVPAGKSKLTAAVVGNGSCGFFGCDPDLDLYVQKAAKPTTSSYACRGYTSSDDETCSVTSPAADWW